MKFFDNLHSDLGHLIYVKCIGAAKIQKKTKKRQASLKKLNYHLSYFFNVQELVCSAKVNQKNGTRFISRSISRITSYEK